MKLCRIALALTLAIAAPLLHAQTPVWFEVAVQDQVVVSTAAITYRFGAPFNAPVIAGSGATPCALPEGCWTAPVTTAGAVTMLANPKYLGNPIPNTIKELDIEETAAAQTVTVDGAVITVPALATPAPAPTPPPTQCPAFVPASLWFGTAGNMAGGQTNVVATVPDGAVYSVDGATCLAAVGPTAVNLNIPMLFILRSATVQIVPVTFQIPDCSYHTNYVQVPPAPDGTPYTNLDGSVSIS